MQQIKLVSTQEVLDALKGLFAELAELDGKKVKVSLIYLIYDLLKALDLASAENIRYCAGQDVNVEEIDPDLP